MKERGRVDRAGCGLADEAPGLGCKAQVSLPPLPSTPIGTPVHHPLQVLLPFTFDQQAIDAITGTQAPLPPEAAPTAEPAVTAQSGRGG